MGNKPEQRPAYVIAEVEVTDPNTLQKYGEKAPQIVASFNGHYVVRGGKTVALEGEPPRGLCRCHRLRQPGEGARVVRLAGLCGHPADFGRVRLKAGYSLLKASHSSAVRATSLVGKLRARRFLPPNVQEHR